MKKLIIALFLLIVLGGVVFYFGWVQIQLDEKTYAVIFTKTNGWDEEVTVPGRFSWRWQRLIPTNMKLHKYRIEPQSSQFSYDGALPSSDLYAGMIEPAPDFSYHISFTVSFTLRPEGLLNIASEQRIAPDELPEYYERIATSISISAAAVLNELSRTEEFALMLASVSPEVEAILLDRVAPGYPEFDIHRILPDRLELPEVELYQTGKELFLEVARSRRDATISQMDGTVRTDTRVEQHFSVLERYGELLEAYPVLLELITIKEGRLDEILEEIERVGIVSESG